MFNTKKEDDNYRHCCWMRIFSNALGQSTAKHCFLKLWVNDTPSFLRCMPTNIAIPSQPYDAIQSARRR